MPTMRAVVSISSPVLGGSGSNTWHLRTSGPVPGAEADVSGLMAIVEDWYQSMSYYSGTTTTFRWDGLASGVDDDEGSYTDSTPWTVAGQGTANYLPPANAVVINWRGQSGDRSRRGRTFYGPLVQVPLQADGTIATTQLGEMRVMAAALVDASGGFDNGALGVYSRQENIFRDFVGSSIRDQFAVLTSRRD